MYDKHYNRVLDRIKQLKTLNLIGNIDLRDGFIDPNLDVIVRSFACIASALDSNIDNAYYRMKKDLIKMLYPLIFNQYVSKAILYPNIVFDNVRYKVNRLSNFVLYCGKDKSYKYRTLSDITLYDLFIKSTSFVSGYDLNIDRTYGNYFLYIKMQSSKHTALEVNARCLQFYVSSEYYNEILFNIFSGSRQVYCLINDTVKLFGTIKLISLDESYMQYDSHILYMISYFTDQKYFNAFVIEVNESFVYADISELNIAINVNELLRYKNILVFNYLYIVNIFSEQSGYHNLEDGLTYSVYTDYYSRDFVKVFSIRKVIATQKGTGNNYCVLNYYSSDVSDGSFVSGLYWIHNSEHADTEYISKITFFTQDEQQIDVIKDYVVCIDAMCCNVVSGQMSIETIYNNVHNFINSCTIILHPCSSSLLNLNNTNIVDSLFSMHFFDFLHARDKRARISNILNTLAYMYKYKYDFNYIIKDIMLSRKFKQVIMHGKYITNIVLYDVKVYVYESYVSKLDFGLCHCVCMYIRGMFDLNSLIDFYVISSDSGKLIFYNYDNVNDSF